MPREIYQPEGSNLLGDALGESRQHFRQLLTSLDMLIDAERLDEARRHLPKLQALGHELRRLLNPSDPVDRKLRTQIERDLTRVQKALKKGWGGALGFGLVALLVGSVLGVAALIAVLFWLFG